MAGSLEVSQCTVGINLLQKKAATLMDCCFLNHLSHLITSRCNRGYNLYKWFDIAYQL